MWLEQLIARHMINRLPFAVTLYDQAVVSGGGGEMRGQERLTAGLPFLWNMQWVVCLFYFDNFYLASPSQRLASGADQNRSDMKRKAAASTAKQQIKLTSYQNSRKNKLQTELCQYR